VVVAIMKTASSLVATIDVIVMPPAWVIAVVPASGTTSNDWPATAGAAKKTPATRHAPVRSSAEPKNTVPNSRFSRSPTRRRMTATNQMNMIDEMVIRLTARIIARWLPSSRYQSATT